jgi:hypothetical protein
VPLELLIVAGIVAVLAATPLATAWLDPSLVMAAGAAVILLGMGTGVPVGAWYHLLLYRRRRRVAGGLEGWWIAPHRFHALLPEADRRLLDRWFAAGAFLFAVTLAGCGLLFLGLVASLR